MREFLRRSFRYNSWANATLLEAFEAGQNVPMKAVAAFQHVFETEQTWFARMMGEVTPNVPLWGTPDLARCREWAGDLIARTEYFFAHLEEAALSHTFSYQNSKGTQFSDRIDLVLNHLLVHSAQYRGEAAGFAIAAGVAVPDLDLIFWHRNGSPAAAGLARARRTFGKPPLSH